MKSKNETPELLDENHFHKNIALWARSFPKAAVFLSYTDSSALSFSKTRQNQLNLNAIIDGEQFDYHSSDDALKESEEWFSQLDLSNIDSLCIYGIGLGYQYDVAKKWLKKNKNRRLVFLDDDLAVIKCLLATKQGTKILKDPQVKIVYFENDDLDNPVSSLTELYWHLMSAQILVVPLPLYEKTKSETYQLLSHKLIYDATVREGILGEYLTYGSSFFKNFYPNMLHLPGSYLGNGLFGKFKNVPAIICGAGPSLPKHLSDLQALHDKALIFAGGSALNVLSTVGMRPHLGAGIDPNEAQYTRLKDLQLGDLPFLFRNRMFHKALQTIKGPHLYVVGSGGYDVSDWFEEQLAIEGEKIEEGFNIVNFCLELASAFGCNPIIFVGVDLAYTDMQSYASGVIKDAKVSEKEITSSSDLDHQALLKKDIYGKPIYTLWKWIAESRWISDFAKEHPDIQVINATEGGLGFLDVPNIPLKKVVQTHLKQPLDITKMLKKEIEKCALPNVTLPKVVEAMKELKESLSRCKQDYEILIEDMNQTIEKIKATKSVPSALQGGNAVLAEIELADEPGYRYVLDIFNTMYSCVLNRDLQRLNIAPSQKITWQKAVKKLTLTSKKLAFMWDVANFNIQFIEHAMNEAKIGNRKV